MKQEQFLKRTETLCDEHKFEIVENPDYHGISRSRIHLRCRECGHKFYWNTSHLGQNMRCPNCKRKYKLSQEMAENIVARQCKQNNFKLVEKFKYVGGKTPLLLKCTKCGAIKMTYFDVFSKSTAKCKHCDMGIIRRKLTKTDEVINKCKLKNYILLEPYEYKSQNAKDIKLRCGKCGHKWTASYSNFIGLDSGCMICCKREREYKKALTTEEFIERAKKIHGDKYSYTNVKYTGSQKKVCIICKKHGFFYQIPASHLKGCGCPKCAKEAHKKQ